jgi:hypothetical protein
MTHCHYFLLLCNIATKEDDNALPSFSSSQTQRRESTQEKNKKKTKRREGAYLQAPALPSHFWFLLLPFYFKCFLLAYFSFQVKKKNCRERRNFPLNSRFALSFLAPTSTLSLLSFYFKHFLPTQA